MKIAQVHTSKVVKLGTAMKYLYNASKLHLLRIIAIGVFCVGAGCAFANPTTNWASWTTAAAGWSGSGEGTLLGPHGEVDVTYSGELWGAQMLAGRGMYGGVDADYWTGYSSPTPSPYLSDDVHNAPDSSDILAMTGVHGITNTLTFSSPITNPVMAFVSMGRPGVEVNYLFDAPFETVSHGRGWWATFYGILPTGGVFEQSGNTLIGEEGDGVIQFHGTLSSISWTSTSGIEVWQGFSVGAPIAAAPEPGSLALIGLAIAGMALARRYLVRSRAKP